MSSRGRKRVFVIKYEKVWRLLKQSGCFTDAERRVLDDLSEWLSYDNAIANSKGHMAPADMADTIDMDRSNFHKLLRSLIRKNAVGAWHSGTKTSYYMNPELYCKGEEKLWLAQQFSHECSIKCRDEGAKVLKFEKAHLRTSLVAPK